MDETLMVAIVSASDSRYFPLLKGLIESLLACPEFPSNRISSGFMLSDVPGYVIDFYVLDAGMEDYQLDWLDTVGVSIVKVKQFSWPVKPELTGQHMIGFLERCLIPHHVDSSRENEIEPIDIFVWMDADTWIQDFTTGVKPYLDKAAKGACVVTAEYDRCYALNQTAQEHSIGWALSNYKKFLGDEEASKLYLRPMFNSGVFAAPRGHSLWPMWQTTMILALIKNQHKPDFGIDQITFNQVLHNMTVDQGAVYVLPATCNWAVTHALPVRCEKTGDLLMPLWPHTRIGIIHLMDNTKFNRVGVNYFNPDTGEVTTGDAIHLDYAYTKKNRMNPNPVRLTTEFAERQLSID
jgi:hypothetical protein